MKYKFILFLPGYLKAQVRIVKSLRMRTSSHVDRVDDVNPGLPIIRNIPYFPSSGVSKVMQDLYHQPKCVLSGTAPPVEFILH